MTKKIENTRAEQLIVERLRISNFTKILLLIRAYVYTKLF